MLWLAQVSSSGGSQNSWINMILLMVPVFVIMYVLMIRPQKVKDKERKEMLSRVKKNDRVLTIGGIHGTIVSVKEDELVIKVDETNNTKLRMAKSAISRVFEEENNREGGD